MLQILDDKKLTLMNVGQLGMSGQVLQDYRRLLRFPYGMIIVCGPTGSGRSTTLYGSILEMDRIAQKVISIEDPVEYHIPDTNQTQVYSGVGVTFATQLRSILRLDPDVILVGEIRDRETAEIATQAALTGHLVLTSLHANDSVSRCCGFETWGFPPIWPSPPQRGSLLNGWSARRARSARPPSPLPWRSRRHTSPEWRSPGSSSSMEPAATFVRIPAITGGQECTSC